MMKTGNYNTNVLQELVVEIIRERQAMKRDNGQSPDSVSIHEIYNGLRAEILETLRSLYRKGIIGFYKTVNGVEMFSIKKNEEN